MSPRDESRAADRPRDPLHGVTLEQMLVELSTEYGWAAMGRQVPIRCFTHEPSVASSLTFLRRTPWARARVEALYRVMVQERIPWHEDEA